MVYAACDYFGWCGGIKSDVEAFRGKLFFIRSHSDGPGFDGFCRQKNDVQPLFLGAPYVVGSAKRQLRQFDFLQRAQSELSLDYSESAFIFKHELGSLAGKLKSVLSKVLPTKIFHN
jgi:hypothetical protein